MTEKNDYINALSKRAKGFSSDEIVEEYVSDEEGNLTLSKRKVSTKYYPPDISAIKSAIAINPLSQLSESELLAEKERLLTEFYKLNEKVKNEKTKKL